MTRVNASGNSETVSKTAPRALVYACLALGLAGFSRAQSAPAPQSAEHAIVPVTYAFDYLLYLPKDYAPPDTSRWPLVVFLHGLGARGNEIRRVKSEGLPKLIEQGRSFPFIVVSPQCPEDEWWNLPALEAFIDEVCRRYHIDPDRVYLTGLSMGGFGTWALAQRDPSRYAAIVPIAGGGETKWAPRLREVPAWVFHGAKDDVVPVKRAQEMVDAIKSAHGSPRLTIYPATAHDAWTQAYADDELYAWLLAQNRRLRPAPAVAP